MNPLPLLVFSVLVTLMNFVTVMASRHQPKGPLPSTYGHLQTVVDNIDDWGMGAKGQLYWGDKGPVAMDYGNGVAVYRRAGTSGDRELVGEVVVGKEYSIY